jgi:hypothetical protein
MKLVWEEIYNNSNVENISFFEATYRAKVIGGWLIRHETCVDYQYGCSDRCEDNPSHRHINEEGYQDIKNVIIFLPDSCNKWDEIDNPMLGVL